jgi:hypothetical protein
MATPSRVEAHPNFPRERDGGRWSRGRRPHGRRRLRREVPILPLHVRVAPRRPVRKRGRRSVGRRRPRVRLPEPQVLCRTAATTSTTTATPTSSHVTRTAQHGCTTDTVTVRRRHNVESPTARTSIAGHTHVHTQDGRRQLHQHKHARQPSHAQQCRDTDTQPRHSHTRATHAAASWNCKKARGMRAALRSLRSLGCAVASAAAVHVSGVAAVPVTRCHGPSDYEARGVRTAA